MAVKRLTTEKQRENLINSKKYKGKKDQLTRQELDELIIIIAKKLGIL